MDRTNNPETYPRRRWWWIGFNSFFGGTLVVPISWWGQQI